MSTEKTRWFGFGVPALVLIGVGIAVGVHMGLGRSWIELRIPVGAYVAIQLAVYICMFWARNRARTRQDYGPSNSSGWTLRLGHRATTDSLWNKLGTSRQSGRQRSRSLHRVHGSCCCYYIRAFLIV